MQQLLLPLNVQWVQMFKSTVFYRAVQKRAFLYKARQIETAMLKMWCTVPAQALANLAIVLFRCHIDATQW